LRYCIFTALDKGVFLPYIVAMKKIGPVTRLKERFGVAQKESKENFDSYLRSLADLDNYRKRMEKELATFKVYANEQLLTDLIAVLDSLDRAVVSGDANRDYDSFHKGIAMIDRYLREILERWGLKTYSSDGEQFDPQRHEAVSTVETDDVPPNTIVEQINKGYMLGEKVLKPAQVTVAKPCPETEKAAGGTENG
jgi:molecular chaperone GrpE